MSARLEAYLARLYADTAERERFLREGMAPADLNDEERAALAAIDRVGLRLAGDSYAAKRAGRKKSWREKLVG